jgi:hypothetical protein
VRARGPDAAALAWEQEQWFAARQFEHTPLAQIHLSGVPREVPLFETLRPSELPTGRGDESAAAPKPHYFGMTNYPLALMVRPDKELWVRLMYAHPRFEPQAIGRLLGHFRRLLEAITENPERRLADIPMLTEGERRQLAGWNETSSDYPRNATIHSLREQGASRARCRRGQLPRRSTYDALNGGQINRASAGELGVVPETRVASLSSPGRLCHWHTRHLESRRRLRAA